MISPSYYEGLGVEDPVSVSLLRVNRQLYREALPILYRNNSFLLAYPFVETFLSSINPTALQMLSRVVLLSTGYDVVGDSFNMLKEATGLTQLEVVIHRKGTAFTGVPFWELPHMDELRQVRVYGTLTFRYPSDRQEGIYDEKLEREIQEFEEPMRAVMVKPKKVAGLDQVQ